MTYDDEILMRRVDGELTPEAGAAIDAAAAADPALAARLAALRSLRTLAREAVPLAPDPRDRDLARLIAAEPAPQPPAVRLFERFTAVFQPRHAPVWAGLAAACFVLGLSFGWLGAGAPERGFTVDPEGAITDAALVRVLDARLTADGADAQGRAVGLTFRDADDRWCRTFHSEQAGVAGLACREADVWRLQALAPFKRAPGELRTASADLPAPILAAVDAVLADDPLDAAAEARARDAGWN
jgi:anti-sigma factor RsiW